MKQKIKVPSRIESNRMITMHSYFEDDTLILKSGDVYLHVFISTGLSCCEAYGFYLRFSDNETLYIDHDIVDSWDRNKQHREIMYPNTYNDLITKLNTLNEEKIKYIKFDTHEEIYNSSVGCTVVLDSGLSFDIGVFLDNHWYPHHYELKWSFDGNEKVIKGSLSKNKNDDF